VRTIRSLAAVRDDLRCNRFDIGLNPERYRLAAVFLLTRLFKLGVSQTNARAVGVLFVAPTCPEVFKRS
jgi:hypothetical protein